jgi:hypothetical protein
LSVVGFSVFTAAADQDIQGAAPQSSKFVSAHSIIENDFFPAINRPLSEIIILIGQNLGKTERQDRDEWKIPQLQIISRNT